MRLLIFHMEIIAPDTFPFELVIYIFYHAHRKLSVKFTEVCKYFSNNEAWRLKCHIQFPNKPYLEWWSGLDNYLACRVKKFAIVVNFSTTECANFIYEHHRSLDHVLGMSEEIINSGMGDCAPELVQLTVTDQFVAIKKESCECAEILGQFPTLELAKYSVEKKRDDYIFNGKEYDGFVIVNLKLIPPLFFRGPERKSKTITNSFIFI